MTEQELRALVRAAIARNAAGAPGGAAPRAAHDGGFATAARQHPSHAMLPLSAGGDEDGPCVIEPAVPCTHCGYCKSYGH